MNVALISIIPIYQGMCLLQQGVDQTSLKKDHNIQQYRQILEAVDHIFVVVLDEKYQSGATRFASFIFEQKYIGHFLLHHCSLHWGCNLQPGSIKYAVLVQGTIKGHYCSDWVPIPSDYEFTRKTFVKTPRCKTNN
mmetsp:Transcript_3798/g.5151  ORF Transcript_3798/g.5151 Transcript_3798/m.5151 type:complete len:136 (+) Transcript_3798:120-527(+)